MCLNYRVVAEENSLMMQKKFNIHRKIIVRTLVRIQKSGADFALDFKTIGEQSGLGERLIKSHFNNLIYKILTNETRIDLNAIECYWLADQAESGNTLAIEACLHILKNHENMMPLNENNYVKINLKNLSDEELSALEKLYTKVRE